MIRASHLLAALLAAAAAAATTPALAAPLGAPAAPQTRVISYADLDLAGAAGRRTLDRRIYNAVREVCGQTSAADLRGRARVAQCRAETLAAAYAQRPLSGEVVVATAQSGR